MPKMVTDDWADAAPDTASTARAIEHFFMGVSFVVESVGTSTHLGHSVPFRSRP